ncbi:copper amine oxidase N-terminal domain-containing protein [Paenibacillus sp. LS1]|uniref:copper amine oxidase N-terminal domain-containing protein n=1 Tax=Paenibacillus sp. LS1 TaxID=2992120 RepID=UPI00222FA8FC|nr:copper amine oxidase N-terminal domain-containing protein [Paenibacillus sp. LS1]MCW3795528.1 copper amine oxidase N-terminal domain-containing protein [Paenibacillus sp. LS1]
MLKKIPVFFLAVGLLSIPSLVYAQNNKEPIQLYVNEKPTDINLMTKSGTVYVPFREFIQLMGYRADYSIESREIFARTDHSETYFVPDVGYFDDKEGYVELEKPGILIDGKFYLPIRFAAWYTKHSVAYDRKANTARMVAYGYGQEQAILDLVRAYDRAFTVKLLASNHMQRFYLTESWIAPQEREIPDRIYNVDITSITYESANQALLYVTYIHNNQVINDQHEVVFRIIKENNQWKILQDRYLSSNTTLPEDIDKSVHTIKENFNEKQQNVLSDLRQYYRAFNQKDFDLTYKYTSPFDIERMNANAVDEWRTWEHITRASFEYGDTTYHMSNERVVFLGEKQAVVHATLEWSYISENIEQNHSIYEALIYLDYANGHWNYSYDHDISVNEEDPNRMLPEIHFPEFN